MATMELIKKLRERTGAGVVDVKKALDEAHDDVEKAVEILRKKGQDKALKKTDRETHEGVVSSYVHSNNRIAALVKLYCETDFVARTPQFQELAKDIAMHVAALAPLVVKPEEVSDALIEKEKEIWRVQLEKEGKSGDLMEKILIGKETKYRNEVALLAQPFVKNPEETVAELIAKNVHQIGENIQVGGFVRYEI